MPNPRVVNNKYYVLAVTDYFLVKLRVDVLQSLPKMMVHMCSYWGMRP